jgi:hypothetical protein
MKPLSKRLWNRTTLSACAVVALLSLVFLAACSGPQHVHPACVDDYNECINGCAYQCDQGATTLGPPYSDGTETVDTWDFGCQACTSRCDDLADRCEERVEGLPPAE